MLVYFTLHTFYILLSSDINFKNFEKSSFARQKWKKKIIKRCSGNSCTIMFFWILLLKYFGKIGMIIVFFFAPVLQRYTRVIIAVIIVVVGNFEKIKNTDLRKSAPRRRACNRETFLFKPGVDVSSSAVVVCSCCRYTVVSSRPQTVRFHLWCSGVGFCVS